MAAETLAFVRPQRIVDEKFDAIKVSAETGKTYQLGEADTFDECLLDATMRCTHRDTLVIRRTGKAGETLHVYQIKKRTRPNYIHQDHVTRRVQPLYPEHQCDIALGDIR